VGKVNPAHARRIPDIHKTNELVDHAPKEHLLSWGLTLLVTAIAALVRWPRLGIPEDVVFDETYYVKDAYALLTNGYEREAVEKANEFLLEGRTDLFQTVGSFVAHPPMGKWIIALGEQIFGLNSFGWRTGVAFMGTLLVLVTTRVAIRLLRSIWFGVLAGFLLAIDGLAIVMSRTALLDGIMTTFIMMGIACLLLDRDYARNRISRNLKPESRFGGRFTWHPSWTGWIRSEDGWGRNPDSLGIVNTLKSLLSYHEQMWNFHINLATDHSYEAFALGWPILLRPTSFYYKENLANCASSNCASEVLAIGNPLIWWSGVIAILLLLINFLRSRNWRAGTIVLLFLFYSIVYLPFLVMAIAYIANLIYVGINARESSRKAFFVIGGILLVLTVVISVFFYPVWTAIQLPKDDWLLRMWFRNWI